MAAGCMRWMEKLVRKKVFTNEDLNRSELRRCLTTWDLIGLGIGNTLGAGVYILSGQVARESAGPAVVLSFLIAGLTASLAGLCYAEFAARVPRTGSAYVYSYVTVGELMAFVIGWNVILEYILSVASVARAISAYVDYILGNPMQEFFHNYMAISVPGLSTYPDFFAFGLVALATAIVALGVKESTRVNHIMSIINIIVIAFIIVGGFYKGSIHNWQLSGDELPESGAGNGGFLPYGFSGVMAGVATCFFSYVGFDFLASMSEETENSRWSVPVSMGATLAIDMVCYCSVAVVVTLMVPYFSMDIKAPVTFAFEQVGWGAAQYVITVGALAGMTSSVMGSLFPMARVVYAMASDGLIFRGLSTVSPRFRTPFLGTVVSGILAGVMALLFDVNQLIDMLSIGTLLAFALVAVCVIVLRYEKDEKLIETQDGTNAGTPKSSDSGFRFIHLIRPNLGTPTESSARTVNRSIGFMFACMLVWIAAITVGYEPLAGLYVGIPVIIVTVFGAMTLVFVIIISRQPQNSLHLKFKVPLVPLVPAMSCVVNVYLMFNLNALTWLRFVVWLIVGFCIYLFYGLRHSSLNAATEERRALIVTDESKTYTLSHQNQPTQNGPHLNRNSDTMNATDIKTMDR